MKEVLHSRKDIMKISSAYTDTMLYSNPVLIITLAYNGEVDIGKFIETDAITLIREQVFLQGMSKSILIKGEKNADPFDYPQFDEVIDLIHSARDWFGLGNLIMICTNHSKDDPKIHLQLSKLSKYPKVQVIHSHGGQFSLK